MIDFWPYFSAIVCNIPMFCQWLYMLPILASLPLKCLKLVWQVIRQLFSVFFFFSTKLLNLFILFQSLLGHCPSFAKMLQFLVICKTYQGVAPLHDSFAIFSMELLVISSDVASPASHWRVPALSREEGEGAGNSMRLGLSPSLVRLEMSRWWFVESLDD